jgi:hypothetical protein
MDNIFSAINALAAVLVILLLFQNRRSQNLQPLTLIHYLIFAALTVVLYGLNIYVLSRSLTGYLLADCLPIPALGVTQLFLLKAHPVTRS